MGNRIFCFILLLMGVAIRLGAQAPATVVHIAGKVARSNGVGLVPGAVVSTADPMQFADANCAVTAWLPGKGLVQARPQKGGKGPLTASFAQFPQPLVANAHADRFANTAALGAHFRNRKYLLIGKAWLRAPQHLLGKADTVVVLKFANPAVGYQYPYKLPVSGDSLLLDPALMFTVDGVPLAPDQLQDFSLHALSRSTMKSTDLCSLVFVVADEAAMKEGILQLWKAMGDKPRAERAQAALALVQATMGDPDGHLFYRWLDTKLPDSAIPVESPDSPANTKSKGKNKRLR